MRFSGCVCHVVAALLILSAPGLILAAEATWPDYFDLGPGLVQEFRGSYEFKYKRLEFVRTGAHSYTVRASGDESPREDKIVLDGDYIYWILGRSGERWLKLRTRLLRGAAWPHAVREWNQRYRVVKTDLTVSVPAGQFEHCAEVTISWAAHEPDMEGVQEVVLYLAPHLGIIKREQWSNGTKEHEEELTSYRAVAGR